MITRTNLTRSLAATTGPLAFDHARGVQIDGLTKSFGAVQAVRGIDLRIHPGEVVALLGPNGAGKSTTLDMLLGLTEPDHGGVMIFGLAPGAAVRIGVVAAMLQTGGLIRAVTVRELLTLVASVYRAPLEVDRAIELAGAGSFADRRTERLSGGETQRARFAMALVADAELLVLDEPTVALDVEARHAFWSSMRELADRGKTVVFATHYLEEADANADRIVLLAAGAIVADGAASEVKARVGTRTIRATLPDVPATTLEALPGVTRSERHGETVTLTANDSDRALRALLRAYDTAHDIEVRGAGLEEAFLELTAAASTPTESSR